MTWDHFNPEKKHGAWITEKSMLKSMLIEKGFPDVVFYWLAAVLPANQKQNSKSVVFTNMDFNMEFLSNLDRILQ